MIKNTVGNVIYNDGMQMEDILIEREAHKRGVSISSLIEKKLMPISQRIKHSPSQLIAAISRTYKSNSFSSDPEQEKHYHTHESLQIGIITEDTELTGFYPNQRELFSIQAYSSFVKDVERPHKIEEHFIDGRKITPNPKNAFYLDILDLGGGVHNLGVRNLLYFHDKPQPTPPDNFVGSKSSVISPCTKPRLEFLIGDNEVAPFLRENLAGYEYQAVEKLLDKSLGYDEKIKKKISDEHYKLYKDIVLAERQRPREEIVFLVNQAKERNYNLTHLAFECVEIEPGVTQDINFAKFFASKINKYCK